MAQTFLTSLLKRQDDAEKMHTTIAVSLLEGQELEKHRRASAVRIQRRMRMSIAREVRAAPHPSAACKKSTEGEAENKNKREMCSAFYFSMPPMQSAPSQLGRVPVPLSAPPSPSRPTFAPLLLPRPSGSQRATVARARLEATRLHFEAWRDLNWPEGPPSAHPPGSPLNVRCAPTTTSPFPLAHRYTPPCTHTHRRLSV